MTARREITCSLPVSQLYPPLTRQALIGASEIDEYHRRIATIDAITDDLARQGYCRRREDESRAAEWARGRAPR